MSTTADLPGGGEPPATGHADRVFRALALASLYILLRRWRSGGGGRLAPAEIAAAAALGASVVWLYVLPALGLRWINLDRRRCRED